MPSEPTSGPRRPGEIGAPRPQGPGRAVRATRALVAVVLSVLVLATVLTALVGGDDAPPAGAPASPSPSPGGVADVPPLLVPLRDLAGDAPPAPTAEGLARELGPRLSDPALGPRVGAAVVDAVTGELLFSSPPPGEPGVVPASTSKLVTGAAALAALGPERRLATRVVAGATPGDLVLVGAGDPTLASPAADPGLRYGGTPPARLAALADDTAAALAVRGQPAVERLLVDAGLFGPAEPAPGWRPSYLSGGSVAPVVALSVDAGRVHPDRNPRHAEPDVAAGQAFAALLEERGVQVGAVARGAAPDGAAELARVESPPVGALVEGMLVTSDNDLAEALGRHVALALGEPPTAVGAAVALGEAAARVGLPRESVAVADGSGLSRESRVQPEALARLLARAAAPGDALLRPLVTGLPVAGFGGTLDDRFRSGPQDSAAGEVRAKTGTLSGVSALAGLVVDAEGRLLAFDVTADAVPSADPRAAEAALDRVVAVLAGCGCA